MTDARYVIRPRFGSVVWHFAHLLLVSLGAVWLVGLVVSMFNGRPGTTLPMLGWGLVAIPAASAMLGLILALLAIPWQCTLTPEGIVGRSYIGFRRRIAYRDLDTPLIDNSQGFPLLRMSDRRTGKELVMYPIGFDLPDVHATLVRWAGPNHPLTLAFRPI